MDKEELEFLEREMDKEELEFLKREARRDLAEQGIIKTLWHLFLGMVLIFIALMIAYGAFCGS